MVGARHAATRSARLVARCRVRPDPRHVGLAYQRRLRLVHVTGLDAGTRRRFVGRHHEDLVRMLPAYLAELFPEPLERVAGTFRIRAHPRPSPGLLALSHRRAGPRSRDTPPWTSLTSSSNIHPCLAVSGNGAGSPA